MIALGAETIRTSRAWFCGAESPSVENAYSCATPVNVVLQSLPCEAGAPMVIETFNGPTIYAQMSDVQTEAAQCVTRLVS